MRQATIALQQKINAAKPGDVLTRGMQQSPESIGTAILKQAGRRR